jgi:hypothetical protein
MHVYAPQLPVIIVSILFHPSATVHDINGTVAGVRVVLTAAFKFKA